jgi:hypothetical protein
VYGNARVQKSDSNDSYLCSKEYSNSCISHSTRKQLDEFIKSSPLNVDKNFTDEPKNVEAKNLKSKKASTILNNTTFNDYDVSEYHPTLSSVTPKSVIIPQNAPEK